MAIRKGNAVWKGTLKEGNGHLKTESGVLDAPYNFQSRFGDGNNTNPEELIGAAHAGCFNMALSKILAENDFEAKELNTDAHVEIKQVDGNFKITNVKLDLTANVPDIDAGQFSKFADMAKENCPVSVLLKGAEISLDAKLSQTA